MKKAAVILHFALFIFLVSFTSAQSCLTSSEDYAVEVVITDYSLFNLKKISEQKVGEFSLPSQYDSRMITIAKETQFPNGLSIKLQIPTKRTEITNPHLKFTSTLSDTELKEIDFSSFNGWSISCEESQCTMVKGQKTIIAREIGTQLEVSIEIAEDLDQCTSSCSGDCIQTLSSSKCIDLKAKNDFNTILRLTGIVENFETILGSYRIVGTGEISLVDIQPTISPYINWQEAIRQELVFLNNKEAISLNRDDIESISSLAKIGQAGQNYRIVRDFENSEWTYYDRTANPVLTSQRECREYFSVEGEKEALLSPFDVSNTFYLIPMIALITGIVVLIALLIIGRALSKGSRSKS